MLTLFILVSALGFAASSEVGAWTIDLRILGGVNASEGQFPYMASLQRVMHEEWSTGHACGASILTDTWLLTAAHCCILGLPTRVYVGSFDLEGSGTYHNLTGLYVNAKYDPKNYWKNDICLLKLKDKLTIGPLVQPITLAEGSVTVEEGDDLLIQGWGYTTNAGDKPTILQVGEHYIGHNMTVCKELIPEVPKFEGYICASGPSLGTGICGGDSGSPLMKGGVQVGVVSFGYTPCGSKYPEFYSRVGQYIDWIQLVTGEDFNNIKFGLPSK